MKQKAENPGRLTTSSGWGVSPGRSRLVNLPVLYDRDRYRETIFKVVSHLIGCDGVAAIYQIGEISEPGVSDIDLIAVFDDGVSRCDHGYGQVLDEADRYLLMHGVFAMSATTFARRDWLMPIFDVRKLYGKDVAYEAVLERRERAAIQKVYAIEFLLVNCVNLANQMALRQLKVRNLLCALKALGYDLRILHDPMPGQMAAFVERVRSLRRSIESMTPCWERQFEEACVWAIECIMQSLGTFVDAEEARSGRGDSMSRIWVNGYLAGMDGGRPRMQVRRSLLFPVLEIVRRLPLPSKITKQCADLQTALCCIRMDAPAGIHGALSDEVELVGRRNAALRAYRQWMVGMHRDYETYDTYRWDPRSSRKWRALRAMNGVVMSPSARTTAGPERGSMVVHGRD